MLWGEMNRDQLRDSVKHHEGYRQEPYRDHLNHWTVGWGHLIHHADLNPYTQVQTLGALLTRLSDTDTHKRWLEEDINNAVGVAQNWLDEIFHSLSHERQAVVVEMAFQLGNRVRTFNRFRAHVALGKHGEAADEMLNSRWHTQTPTRCETLAERYRSEDA